MTRAQSRLALLSSTVLAVGLAASSRAEGAGAAAKGPPPNMERYSLVLLVAGPNREQSEEEAQRIQSAHLAHLGAMADSGKMILAGPFADQSDPTLRGACIYRVGIDEARALAESDPAVKAGRLKVTAMSWWVEKGYVAFPKAKPLPEAPAPAK